MDVLRSRLLAKTIDEANKARLGSTVGTLSDDLATQWGSQIRSVVLNPYLIAKDHRTMYSSVTVVPY